MDGLIIPIIKVSFLLSISGFIVYYVSKAINKAWTKQTKFFFKYKIFKKEYPDATFKWCLECIDNGIGYYDAKRKLFVAMIDKKEVNETMWIFDQILNEMENIKGKGRYNKDDRKFKGSDRKIKGEKRELPRIT